MKDVRGFFGAINETSEGFKAACPRCGDKRKIFHWNAEKGVGCCHQMDCAWYHGNGGVTQGRLLAFFSKSGVDYAIPEVIVEAEDVEIALPEGFKLISEIYKDDLQETLYAYLRHRGIPKKIVDRAKLGYCDKGDRWGYIIMPVFDNGEVVYWQGRRFKNREPKFYNPAFSKKDELLYCVSKARRPKRIIIVESVLNALTLESIESSSTAVVALLGKNLSDIQRDKIFYYEKWVGEIVVALDPDAIREAADISQRLQLGGLVVRLAVVPEGEDINSLGREKAWQVIRAAKIYDPRKRIQLLQGKS